MKTLRFSLYITFLVCLLTPSTATPFFCGDALHPQPAGDINGDCRVDILDLQIFAQEWLAFNCAASNNCNGADLDLSGMVTLDSDFSRLSAAWLHCTAPECLVPGQQYVVFGFNDLGMHCTQPTFADFMILPLYNDLHAEVIRRGGEPHIVSSGVTIDYSIPSNTYSVGAIKKTDFWDYAPALFGITLAPNVGLAGNGLAGTMSATGHGDWVANGIPITPILDNGQTDPYPLSTISVMLNGNEIARTQAVVPVSTEMNCQLCHNTPGISVSMDILQKHDQLHPGYNLASSTPVACGTCHRQEPLASLGVFPGDPQISSLSHAMHNSHKSRFTPAVLTVLNDIPCYACHPGIVTQCLRDVHSASGMVCMDCHGSMNDVASLARQPWIDEPRCGTCHPLAGNPSHANYQFEQPGTLFRNSKGHMGVHCEVCLSLIHI